MLTNWLKTLYNDCNFRIKYKTLNKEHYAKEWESKNLSINPIKPPEFYCKGISLGEMQKDLESMYVEVVIDNAGCRQPHEFILSGIYYTQNKYFLTFVQEYSNWPISRIVIFNEYNQIIRNDFKTVYNLSWKDYEEEVYQPKKKKVLVAEERERDFC